ncbi:MarR family transcriptional regulator (plasmid) [Streptomyces sp. Q6]|uniref:MarR family transcriptional regulator n=1 Tax=Streptomyces citrinus TaxID=3118173 RepID=A0ACD5AR11_9ACTN
MALNDNPSANLALELVRTMDRLRGRIRSETGMGASPWSRSQLAALHRVVYGSPATTSDLAAAEYMRPQSMAQTIGMLEQHGLVARRPDPGDGRRMLITATPRGRKEAERWLEAREAWLTAAIDQTLTAEERAGLTALMRIMERLADSDVPSEARRGPGRASDV